MPNSELLQRVLETACERYGLVGFSANDNVMSVEAGLDPQGGLSAIALYTQSIWRQMGLGINDLYNLTDDDDGRDDGFPWVIVEDEDALFGHSVILRDTPDIPLSMFFMITDFALEHLAVTARLSMSMDVDEDEDIIVDFTHIMESLTPEVAPDVRLSL